MAIRGEAHYERLEREPEFGSPGNLTDLETYRLSPGFSFFHASGLTTALGVTYVAQKGKFGDPSSGFFSRDDQFWILDASLGYRLPKRAGFVSLEGHNLLDQEFNYQEEESAMPRIARDRLVLGRLTLSF